jgi:hypothetical protein
MIKAADMRRGLEIYDDEWLRQEAAMWKLTSESVVCAGTY